MLNTYNDIVKHLDGLGMFHMKPGQDRMTIALQNLNLLPLPYKAVQIVGTNGKGSTSTYLSFLAQEHNLSVGLYTSPHFLSPKERILHNNKQLDNATWEKAAQKVYNANPDLSYFEFLTVLAAQIYADLQVDIVFFEAGLGGKFDATTALECATTIFTPIALDHCSVLGNTIQEIAEDKANAINHWTKTVISANQVEKALEIIKNRCNGFNLPLHLNMLTIYSEEKFELSMMGKHQQANAKLALEAWRLLCKDELQVESIETKEMLALKKAFIPGRIQYISKALPLENVEVILDGAHNSHGLRSLREALEENSISPDYIIFSCLDDKITDEFYSEVKLLCAMATTLIPEISDNPRAIDAKMLAQKLAKDISSTLFDYKNLDECVKHIQNECRDSQVKSTVIICGSLYLLSDFYTLFPQYIERQAKAYYEYTL